MFFLYIYTLVGGKVSFAFRGFCGNFCVCQCRRVITYEKKKKDEQRCFLQRVLSRRRQKLQEKKALCCSFPLLMCLLTICFTRWSVNSEVSFDLIQVYKEALSTYSGSQFSLFSPKKRRHISTKKLWCTPCGFERKISRQCATAAVFFFFFFIGAESFFFLWPSIVFFCLETGALLTEDAPAFWCPRRRLRQAYANAHTDGSAQERRKRAFFFSLFLIISEYNCFYPSHIRKHCGTKAGAG